MKSQQKLCEQILQEVKSKRIKYAQTILKSKVIEHKGYKMRFEYFLHGQKPTSGYRLVFGLHGGGGCPFQVNQQQWNNHKHLYDSMILAGTIWFVPRSAEQASDMWWKWYIPEFMTLIVQYFSIMNMIDTNRVFISGYSAGGDGVYHLASMMADVLAGAAMMAGHPNKADCYNLRNLAFSVQVGDHDHAYDRANWGKVYIQKINELGKEYGGFKQYSKVHEKTQHWMAKKDAHIFPKFFQQTRQPYPQFILFRQHPRTFKRTFYYLKLEEKHQGLISVRRNGNVFQIQSQQKIPIRIMLNSNFIDFSKEVTVFHNGDLTLSAKPKKSLEIMNETAEQFVDPWYVFEEELISIPTTNLPKDYKVFRPYGMKNSESSLLKIKQMEENIVEDQKLHVSFKLDKKEFLPQLSSQDSQPIRLVNNHPHHHSRGISQKIKKLQEACDKKCQIF